MEKLTSETLFEHLYEEHGIVKNGTTYYRYNSTIGIIEFMESNEVFERWEIVSKEQLKQLRNDSKEYEIVEYDRNLLGNVQFEEVVFVLEHDKDLNRHSVLHNGEDFYIHFTIHDTYMTVPFERVEIENNFITGKWKRAEKVNKFEETIRNIKDLVRKEWVENKSIGEQKATEIEFLLRERISEYAEALGETELTILLNWENQRKKSVTETYLEGYLTPLHGREVHIFDTLDEWYISMGEEGYRCSQCGGVSDIQTICTLTTCAWNIFNKYTNLDKCVYVYVRETEQGSFNFKPITWENVNP